MPDPFDDVEFGTAAPAEKSILSRGRYMLPRLDGTKQPRGWMRVSNLVSAYSDQYALRVWEHLQVMKALMEETSPLAGLNPEAIEQLPFGERAEAVEDWLAKCKAISGGDEGSRFGTQRHTAVEGLHAGLPSARHDAGTRRHLSLYESTLQRHGLVALKGMQERIVHVPVLEVCGRIDNILAEACEHNPLEHCGECFDTGWTNPVIGDLKTQRKFHTWLEIGAQFACYANAEAMWDEENDRWVDMPHVSKDVALALWMPRETDDGEPRVDVWEVDIRAGWKTAQRAYEVVQDRREAKSTAGNRAWLRPAPPVTDVERYAARYAAVESFREGRDLSAEIRSKGLWCEPIAVAASKAFERLTQAFQA